MSMQDAYPLATQDGIQIRADFVRPVSLRSIAFNPTQGSAPVANAMKIDTPYILLATEDCLVFFNGVASPTPSGNSAIVLQAGERAQVLSPTDYTGVSVLGLVNSGQLYIQEIIGWAGLINPAASRRA